MSEKEKRAAAERVNYARTAVYCAREALAAMPGKSGRDGLRELADMLRQAEATVRDLLAGRKD